ncbi:hypothetical protein M1403_01795 [Patescibacteria group bacterium]|nr:hypothetical protein [Patescibacteria group bacterium]
MAKEENGKVVKCKCRCWGGGGGSGAIYGFGFLGALVYFLQHSTSFQSSVIGVVEAIVWPGMLIYRVLGLLGF